MATRDLSHGLPISWLYGGGRDRERSFVGLFLGEELERWVVIYAYFFCGCPNSQHDSRMQIHDGYWIRCFDSCFLRHELLYCGVVLVVFFDLVLICCCVEVIEEEKLDVS